MVHLLYYPSLHYRKSKRNIYMWDKSIKISSIVPVDMIDFEVFVVY